MAKGKADRPEDVDMMPYAERVLGDRLTPARRQVMLDAAKRVVASAEAEAARRGIELAPADVDGLAELGLLLGFKTVRREVVEAKAAPSGPQHAPGGPGDG